MKGQALNIKGKQYTIRNVPARVDQELRKIAKSREKSMNELLLETLARAVGVGTEFPKPMYNDLDTLIGSWQEDPNFEAAIAGQSKIDKKLWK